MIRIPEPEHTPKGPAYEGRLLDHPDEEVVDQGASFDLRTLVSRRAVLGLVGAGIGTVTLAACTPAGSQATTGTSTATAAASTPGATTTATLPGAEIPDETAGPYPGDGSNGPDVLEESGIIRSDIRQSLDGGTTAEGVPLTFSFTITDMANGDVPFEGVAVYAWHCDAQGRYSMYSEGIENETYLRGVQVADATGTVSFTSIFPACYSGRWPHIHFEVYPDAASITDTANVIATSQMALPQAACDAVYADAAYSGSVQNLAGVTLETDNVFGEDGGALQLATVSGDTSSGYLASLTVRVDTTTEPTGGDVPDGGGQGGGQGGPGTPGGGQGGPGAPGN